MPEATRITMPEYEEQVCERSRRGYHYDAVEERVLEAGKSSLTIQKQGGFITAGRLTDATGETVPIFYSGGDLHAAKLRASHFASPMGPSEELGEQHGWPRWTDYDIRTQQTRRGFRAITHAQTPADYFQLERTVDLRPHDVTFTNFLKLGRGQEVWEGSTGEHFYFALPNGDADGLKVGFPALRPGGRPVEPFSDAAVFTQVMSGESHFCPEFNGTAAVTFPDGKKLLITSYGEIEDYPGATPRLLPTTLLGMLLWRSPSNPDSFSAEPTLGYNEAGGQINNQGLRLEPGALLIMRTTVAITA